METEDFVRERIALLRAVMIFGIVVLHTPDYVPLANVGSGAFDFVKAFFQHAAFRTTVAVLTFISGFLLFRSGLDRRPAELARKKLKTIAVPFLAFNLTLLAVAYLLQVGYGLRLSLQLTPFDLPTWLDAAFGLTTSPINYPLNFLRDLLVLMAMAPLLGWMLRNCAWPGLGLLVVVFYNDLDGYLVLRDLMPVIFYIGGMAAVRRWNMRALDRFAGPFFVIFVALCTYLVYFKVANTYYLRLLAPLLIWPAASLLVGTRLGGWLARMSKYSFFVFVAHAPVLLATWMAYKPLAAHIPYPLYWAVAPFLTTAIVVAVYCLAMRHAPGFVAVILGRGPTAKKPEAAVVDLAAGEVELLAKAD